MASLKAFRPFKTAKLVLATRNYSVPKQIGEVSPLKGEVKNLYKNLIYLSREWHTDLRPQIRGAFIKNKDISDPAEIRKLIDKGEYICRELIATYHLKKYRAMKRRYYSENNDKNIQELFDSLK